MATLTTHEFDHMLAAFSFVLERAIDDPPAYFDIDGLMDLQDAVEELRLSALENEAGARMAMPDLDSAMIEWMNMMGERQAPDK